MVLFLACFSQPANQVSNEPRKYTPSQTWNAVHSDARNGSPTPGAYTPPKASPYRPPPAPTQQNTRPPAPSPSTNTRGYGQQMHAPDKYSFMFE